MNSIAMMFSYFRSTPMAKLMAKPFPLNISRNENKLPALRVRREASMSFLEQSQLYSSHNTISESNHTNKVFLKKTYMNVSQAEDYGLLNTLSVEVKLPQLLDRTADAFPAEHLNPSIIEKEVAEKADSKPMIDLEVPQDEWTRIIKEKLTEYKPKNPDSKIFQEEIETLRAIEHNNGLYIGKWDDINKRHGYGK